MLKIFRAVGIDLGTTNSEIALLVPSEREFSVYEDRFGRRTVPSAVAWDAAKESFVIGRPARAKRGKLPLIESVKRSMGQPRQLELGPHQLSPEQVSAKILAELVSLMGKHLDGQAAPSVTMCVTHAVITVPAYFDAPQVEATRRAGELAGLSVLGILQEPTAAAIYHAFKHSIQSGHFLIYDLGGGTFDVSILRSIGGEYQVLAIDGDNFLGGDDFDRRYAEHLRKTLVSRGYALEFDIRKNPEDRARFEALVHVAQEIKEGLSSAEVLSIAKHDLFEDQAGESVSIELDVGRAEYEEIVADLVERSLACVARALEESQARAGIGLAEIDHVILVGGSTRLPLVRRRVTEALSSKTKNAEPLQEDVDTIVALGAAVHAAQLGGLGIQQADCRVRLTSPLVHQTAGLRLGLLVEEPKDFAGSVVIYEGENEVAKTSATSGEPAQVDLGPGIGEDREYSLSLENTQGVVGKLPFGTYSGQQKPRASALSRASVVFKDIGIEINKGGRRQRKVLLAKGTGLPAEASHVFGTGDQSGAVVLRLMQGRMPIKTLALTVPADLPIGSKVDLTLRIDDCMRIEAKAEVAGQELWATVDAPETASFEGQGAVENLLSEAEDARRQLWGTSKTHYEREADFLMTGIRECLGTDPAKLGALCANLKQLVDDFAGDPTDPMRPPRAQFEAELDGLRRVVYRASGVLMGLDRAGWEGRIQSVEERANAAYEANDPTGWRRAVNEVQALYETAIQEEFAGRRLDDPAYLQQRSSSITRWRMRLGETLTDLVLSQSPEIRALQTKERERLRATLQDKVDQPLAALDQAEGPPPADLRQKLDVVGAELERVEAAIDRLPSLGLVTERSSDG